MNPEKQHAKLKALWIKAENVLNRKDSQKVLKKVKKIARKLGQSEE